MRQQLIDSGKQLFVDMKLHDIGNTVASGVKSVSRIGATFLTVHAYPQTMKAAVEAREGGLRILAVTVLTSYDDADLAAAGYDFTVARACRPARGAGTRHRRRRSGLLGEEAAKIRAHCRAQGCLGDRQVSVRPAPTWAIRSAS